MIYQTWAAMEKHRKTSKENIKNPMRHEKWTRYYILLPLLCILSRLQSQPYFLNC